MTNLTTFNYLSSSIRVIEIDDQPWFLATDVCVVLGLQPMDNGNGVATYSHHLRKLASDERRTVRKSEVSSTQQSIFGWRTPAVSLVSEPGLYALIGASNRPEAKAFDRWVRHEVLPAIRKDGAYIKGEELVKAGELDEEEFVLRAMEILQRKVRGRLDAQIRAASAALHMA